MALNSNSELGALCMAPFPYVGRFAPSPTGLLHMGSMMAAVASYLDARRHAGKWLLRIEDVDAGRTQRGADAEIRRTLSRFGFVWDDEVVVQSERHHRYLAVLHDLIAAGEVYPCCCTRKQIVEQARMGVDGLVYPGTCRSGMALKTVGSSSWRLSVTDEVLEFFDLIQGRVEQNLARDVGDFVLLRADGFWAYQLAVVIDDADFGVTHVVRGADLLDSTPRQIFLQQRVGAKALQYAHIPVVADEFGAKLSKQTRAPILTYGNEGEQLWQCLRLLWQQPPVLLRGAPLHEVWSWAFESWDLSKIPQKRSVSVTIEQKNEYKILL